MKKYFILFIALFIFNFGLHPSFDCSKMIFFTEGASIVLSSFDKDRKPNGTIKNKYSKIKSVSEGTSTTVNSEFYDKKGKLQTSNEFAITCKAEALYFDLKSLIPEQNQKPFEDMEMILEGSNLEYPSNISVGQKLNDAGLLISYKSRSNGSPIPMMNISVNITNRKVEAKETVTTSAGTFDCYKITEDFETKTLFKIKGKSINWFSFEVGSVKTESYKENGKLTGYTELTEIKKS